MRNFWNKFNVLESAFLYFEMSVNATLACAWYLVEGRIKPEQLLPETLRYDEIDMKRCFMLLH
jgi:hypothetical protein